MSKKTAMTLIKWALILNKSDQIKWNRWSMNRFCIIFSIFTSFSREVFKIFNFVCIFIEIVHFLLQFNSIFQSLLHSFSYSSIWNYRLYLDWLAIQSSCYEIGFINLNLKLTSATKVSLENNRMNVAWSLCQSHVLSSNIHFHVNRESSMWSSQTKLNALWGHCKTEWSCLFVSRFFVVVLWWICIP